MEYEGFQHAIEEEDDEEECFELHADGRKKFSNTRNGVLVNRIVGKPRVKKTVSFAENGNVYRVFDDTNDSTDGSDSSDGHGECTQNHNVQKSKGNSEHTVIEAADLDNSESGERSDDERKPRRKLRIGGHRQDQDGSSVFSAPVPVKMESRADLIKKRTAVEIVT
uniref:Uncharacterized protein n=1 Tax=Rhizophora mucronata TaxID=61149 RepID=A0A2P2JEW7_RHIMU